MQLSNPGAMVKDLQNKRSALGSAIPRKNAAALVGLTCPKGWVKITSSASITYRPQQNPMPSVKVHLTSYRIDIDEKNQGKVTSRTLHLTSLDELVQQTKALLEQFS